MKKLTGPSAIVIYSGLLAFGTVTIIALQLGAEDFGRSAYIQALALWLSFGCTMGLPYQMRQELAGARGQPVHLYKHGSNFVVLTLVVSGGFAAAALITGFLSLGEVLLTAAYCTVHSVFTLDQSFDLGCRRYVLYARKQAEYVTIANVGCIVHLYFVDVGWEYRIVYQIIGLLAPMFLRPSNITMFIPWQAKKFSISYRILKRSVFVSAHSSVDKIYTHLDKVFVGHLFGSQILGFYALAVTLASSINLITKMPFAHYEQNVLGCKDVRATDKPFINLSALLIAAASLFGAAAMLVPDTILRMPALADLPYAKPIVVTSGYYVAAKLIFSLTFPRFLRLHIEHSALWFDLALAVPVLGLSSIVGRLFGPEAFQITASFGFVVVATWAVLYTRKKGAAASAKRTQE